ncbi:ACT domain-containing protein ACR1-like isoform X1 [Ipomoea triloba]|uniref:ACT domain-containing protein ACR1-like isoform X1 n=2 Tax=Ipomoea triloba TaxID=35885 RepID=UPI00125E6272|nr:ACT domain-containing protein ACR1-like isoform X1 [Ipomoea triloba]
MEIGYKPYVDPAVESIIERIHPPRVCIDNDTCRDCTLVKVDSANKHGILLEMVQVLTDLDLLISKSYICSDGGWLMDVFHVKDRLGCKITDEKLIRYIQQSISENKMGSREDREGPGPCIGRDVRPWHVLTNHTALEMTTTDRPGLMSEISAVLAETGCHISAAVVWTHNARAACILYVDDPSQLPRLLSQLENVLDAHHCSGGSRSVMRLSEAGPGQTHTERRLHQLLAGDSDYEQCCSAPERGNGDDDGRCYRKRSCTSETYIKIENCEERGYSIVTIRSGDRPKLLFDTICALTDMHYVVFHASISSHDSKSFQEYYIRHKDGWTLNSEIERHRLTQCLIAATERRISHGLRLDVCTQNRLGLLSDITRVFRENGLSITMAEIGTRGDRAEGTFYLKDVSGQTVKPETLESLRKEIIGGTVLVVHKSPGRLSQTTSSSGEKPGFSLGGLLWAQVEKFSNNYFRPIKY